MRYYEIDIFDDAAYTQKVASWTSLDAFGRTNPGALNVELDIPLDPANIPVGSASVRVWGIRIADISYDWRKKFIRVKAGMAKGLPLANPDQRGLVLQGIIFQSFGNWQGVNMSLDFIVNPGSIAWGGQQLRNFSLDWKKGTTLQSAINTSMETALRADLPAMNLKFAISPNLIASDDRAVIASDLSQFAQAVLEQSKATIKDANYKGVSIAQNGSDFTINDGSDFAPFSKELQFQDFIGQPTWIEATTISAKVVMRHDITMLDIIKIPDIFSNLGIERAKSYEFIRNGVTFAGIYQVTAVRHIGNFRQADASSWVTVLNLTAQTKAA